MEAAITRTLPTGPGQRHRRVFDLARELKAIPELRTAGNPQLMAIVRRWRERALPMIRTKPLFETLADFADAWQRVRHPAGSGPLADALARAKANPPPKVAQQFDEPDLRLLVALCRELQRTAGDGPFFLSCRTAAELLGLRDAQGAPAAMRVHRWLRALEFAGVLVAETRGQRAARKATEFRYLGD